MLIHAKTGITGMVAGSVVGVLSLMWTAPVHAANHLWLLSEVFSDSTGDVQFIEMHNDFQSEGFMAGTTLTAMNSDMSVTHSFTFPSNLSDTVNTANRFLLIATADFNSLPGSVTPDFVLPADFLFIGGGSLSFSASGDSVTFGALPTDGVTSLTRNLSMHVLGPATNSPTNFAGEAGSVVVPEPAGVTLGMVGAGLLLARRPQPGVRRRG